MRSGSASFSALTDGNGEEESDDDDERDDNSGGDTAEAHASTPNFDDLNHAETTPAVPARALAPTPPSSPDFYPADACLPGLPGASGWDSSPDFFVSEADEYAVQPPNLTLGHTALDAPGVPNPASGESKSNVPSLFLLCQRALATSLCPSTIVSTLHVSRLHMADELHLACRQWLQEKFDVFLVQGISEVTQHYSLIVD